MSDNKQIAALSQDDQRLLELLETWSSTHYSELLQRAYAGKLQVSDDVKAALSFNGLRNLHSIVCDAATVLHQRLTIAVSSAAAAIEDLERFPDDPVDQDEYDEYEAEEARENAEYQVRQVLDIISSMHVELSPPPPQAKAVPKKK